MGENSSSGMLSHSGSASASAIAQHNAAFATTSYSTMQGIVTALSYDPHSARPHLLVALKKRATSWIDILDVREGRRESLGRTLHISSVQEWVSLDKSRDGRYIVAQGGAPDYMLVLWKAIEGNTTSGTANQTTSNKFKVVGQICSSTPERDPVYQCSISPDSKLICVTGNSIFKLYKFDEGVLKPVQSGLGKREQESYVCHCWLTERRVVVSNDHGDLFIIEDGDYSLLPSSPSDSLSINAIIKYEKGFICGGENGVVTIFDKSDDDKEMYRRSRTLKINNDDKLYDLPDLTIQNFAYDVSTEFLALTTSAGQIYIVNLSRSEILKDAESIQFNYLQFPTHFKEITGLDTCVQKPYIATCSLDKTVRIYDYQKNEMALLQKFNTEAYSLALHPTGLYVVVGFSDKLKFMKILGDKLEEEKFFAVRKCPEVRFSNGGQFFAAVNGTVISVYSSYTMQQLHVLRGHTGRVKSIFWQPLDTHICSVGMDGSVYEFNVFSDKKVNDNMIRQCNFSSVVSDGKTIYAVGSDANLRLFQDSIEQHVYPTGDYAMTALAFSKRQRKLYAGLEDGSIRAFPVTSLLKPEDEMFIHEEQISRMTLNYFENLLVSVSGSCMSIFEVSKDGKKPGDVRFSEEILISLNDLMDKDDKIQDLDAKYAELRSDNDYAQRRKEIEFNQRVKEQASNFNLEMKQKVLKIQGLTQERAAMEREYKQKIKDQKNRHEKERAEIEHQFKQRIAASMNQLKELNIHKEKERIALLNEAQMSEEQHRSDVQQLQEDASADIRRKQEEINRLREEKSVQSEENETIYLAAVKANKEQIDKLIDEFERKVEVSKDESHSLNIEKLQREQAKKRHEDKIRELKEKIKQLEQRMKQKKQELEQKRKETESVMKENKEREDTILEKEKRIEDLQKQNQELEKFKFVLEYKIKTLNEQIEPNKESIENLKADMSRMKVELNNYIEEHKTLKLQIKDLKLKITANTAEIEKLDAKIRDQDAFKARMRLDIHDVVQHLHDTKVLKQKIKAFYHKHVGTLDQNQDANGPGAQNKESDFDVHKEHDRKRAYLEKTVDSLRTKLVKANKTAKGENMRIMHENVVLLKEINQLRRESRILKARLREKEDRPMSGMGSTRAFDENKTGLITDLRRQLEEGKEEIHMLRSSIYDLEAAKRARSRPVSRERMPQRA